jgi:hypothetical protein
MLNFFRSIIPDDNFIETSRAVPQRVRPNGSITPAAHLPIRRFRNNYSYVLEAFFSDFQIRGIRCDWLAGLWDSWCTREKVPQKFDRGGLPQGGDEEQVSCPEPLIGPADDIGHSRPIRSISLMATISRSRNKWISSMLVVHRVNPKVPNQEICEKYLTLQLE